MTAVSVGCRHQTGSFLFCKMIFPEPEFLCTILRAHSYSETLITKALHELRKATDDQSRSLVQPIPLYGVCEFHGNEANCGTKSEE